MALQDFIGIASSAPEPVRAGDTSAQIPAALYQRAEQNSRYLMEWRGPTCVWHYPADYSGGEGVGPSFPTLAFARWAAFGPYRYHVPDVGTGAIPSVDVQIVGAVSTRRVRVAMISNQGLGFIPNSEWLDANAQTKNVGDLTIEFSGVAVAPGWNDLFLLLESEADWTPSNDAADWVISTLDPSSPASNEMPILRATSGDLAISCPAIAAPVPFVGVRWGAGLANKDDDAQASPPYTIALANCDASDPPVVPWAMLAEMRSAAEVGGYLATGATPPAVYWSTLGTLQIYSVAVTPYAVHPDKANDPSLRFLQAIGSNVANVYWQGSRLNALRQTQVGSAVQPQSGTQYNGVWRAFVNGGGSGSGGAYAGAVIRETSISTRGRQPSDGDGAVSIEVSIPVLAADYESFGGSNVNAPIVFDCDLELFNVTTGAVFDSLAFANLALPKSETVNPLGAPVQAAFWLRRIAQMGLNPDWLGAGASGAPWSHDGATMLRDLRATFYPLILRLPLGGLPSSPDSWGAIRGSGDLFSVRLKFTGLNRYVFSTYVAFGPLTARIDWGT